MITKRSIQKELYKLFDTFFLGRQFVVDIKCLDLYNAYNPLRDEVVTYKYKVHITIDEKVYIYDGWCYEEELKHFRKWLNQKIKNGEIIVCNTAWYHCDENDGIGTDWWDCLEAVKDYRDRFNPKEPDDFIENAEYSVEEYCQTLTDEEFAKFETLSEEKQYRIAMKWRINMYNEAKAVITKGDFE